VYISNLLYTAPNPPQNIRASVINSTTVEVTWHPPSITNGILRYYTVVYSSSDGMEMMEVNSSDVTVLVSALDPFTNYTFYVLAVTVAPSEASDSYTVLTDEAGVYVCLATKCIILYKYMYFSCGTSAAHTFMP